MSELSFIVFFFFFVPRRTQKTRESDSGNYFFAVARDWQDSGEGGPFFPRFISRRRLGNRSPTWTLSILQEFPRRCSPARERGAKKYWCPPPPRYLACCERDRGKQILRERSSRNLAIPIFAHDISYPTLTYTKKSRKYTTVVKRSVKAA